jgi:DNA-binding transcriptional MerR regulator
MPDLAARGPNDGPAGEGAEPGDKRAGAFRTISEVAADLDVPQHVLRFWETRFGQIRPLKRAGGRRYYRPEDVDLVAGIRHLLHVRRYTIKGAQRVIRENGVRFVQAVGRGEAVAGAPALHDADVLSEAGRADRAALEDALRDLYACRDALAALRGPAADA